MRISAKTLAAAKKAAKEQGMSLDAWAEQVLANAALANHPSAIDALLKNISSKIDQVVDRQSLGERVNEQLAAAIKEASSSYEQAKKTTGQILGDVGSRTSSAVEEVAGKARELIGQVNKSAADFAERLASSSETEPSKPARKRRAPTKAMAATSKAATSRAATSRAAKPQAAKSRTAKPKATARRPAASARKSPVKRPRRKT